MQILKAKRIFAEYWKLLAILTFMVDTSCLIEMMACPISTLRALASPRRIDDMLWYILMTLISYGQSFGTVLFVFGRLLFC
jgi:hypothetical protein